MDDVHQILKKFWLQFTTDWYEIGWGDTVEWSGALKTETVQDAISAMSYIRGATDMCKLATTFGSLAYQRACFIGNAASRLRIAFEEDPQPAIVTRLCQIFTGEVQDLLPN